MQIPDKFKNQDGSLNTEALIKSQADGQSYASQVKNDMEQMRAENAQLLQLGEDMQRELATAQAIQPQSAGDQMTDEEVTEYNANPKAFMAKQFKADMAKMNQKVDDQRQDSHKDRIMDFKVASAQNKVQGYEGYKELEQDITSILGMKGADGKNIVGMDPRMHDLAFNAALGSRMPEIINEAKNTAFTAGYDKHKEEMTRQISPGGGSTLPAGGAQLDKETIDGMTPEQMVAAGLVQVHPSK